MVLRRHFPRPPASEADIARFEAQWDFQLDPDLRAFYRACNGANLFKERGPTYQIISLDEIVRARVAVYGEDDPKWGPASILVICDVQDGNYLGIDISSTTPTFPILDIFHETFPEEAKVIAPSFGDFLHEALRSEGYEYWLSSQSGG